MKREEFCILALKSIVNTLNTLDNDEILWILNNQLPDLFCFDCGEPITDCGCIEN